MWTEYQKAGDDLPANAVHDAKQQQRRSSHCQLSSGQAHVRDGFKTDSKTSHSLRNRLSSRSSKASSFRFLSPPFAEPELDAAKHPPGGSVQPRKTAFCFVSHRRRAARRQRRRRITAPFVSCTESQSAYHSNMGRCS